MRPGLEEMHKKDIEKKRRLGESDMTIGISQAQDLGTRSKNEYVLFCFLCPFVRCELDFRSP